MKGLKCHAVNERHASHTEVKMIYFLISEKERARNLNTKGRSAKKLVPFTSAAELRANGMQRYFFFQVLTKQGGQIGRLCNKLVQHGRVYVLNFVN